MDELLEAIGSRVLVFLRVLLEAVSIVAFLAIHAGINRAARFFLPDFIYGLTLLEAAFFVAFACVYAHQAWDMVVIMVPGLRQWINRKDEHDHQ